jgi:hypothetical protein
MQRHAIRRPNVFFIALALIALSILTLVSPTSYAQAPPEQQQLQNATIAFSNPSALQVTLGEGSDFATMVLGDAWDMDKPRDMGFQIGFTNIKTSNGIWSGAYSGIDHASGAASAGYFYPQFQGFSGPAGASFSETLPFTKVGAEERYAIDTTKYTQLSYRLAITQDAARSSSYVQWTNAIPVRWPRGENRLGFLDGCAGTNTFIMRQGWNVYNFDLTVPQGDPNVYAGSWQSNPLVRGFHIEPSAAAPAGTEVKVDWIRLSDPRSAPTIAIPWNASAAARGDRVDIYLADNPTGVDASPLAVGLDASSGSYNLLTSMLPPGQHYFQLRLKDGSLQNGCTITKHTSAWVGPLTITPAPVITFAQPSMISGPDYATTELGKPWDMNSSEDIVTPAPPYPQTVTDVSFNNSIFRGRAIINPPQVESDSQFWLRIDPNRPINSKRYRYFTIRMKLDLPPDKDIHWAIAYGWGGRIIWWNQGLGEDGSESKYGTYFDGWNNYSIDLARARPPLPVTDLAERANILTPREENSFPAQLGWTQLGTVRNLRYDPFETMAQAIGTGADIFQIDWVRLTANDEVRQGQTFPIEAGLNIAPSTLTSLRYYYTTDRQQPTQNLARSSAGAAATQIAPAATHSVYLPLIARPLRNEVVGNPLSFAWNTTGVTPGTYYICAVAETSHSTATWCSDTPVEVLP